MTLLRRRPVLVGGVVTALATAAFFVLPAILPADRLNLALFRTTGEVSSGNPLTRLRFLGGVPGAMLAGYLARNEFGNADWDSALRTGLFAALFGLGLAYLLFVVYNLVSAVFVDGIFPPPVYVTFVIPFLFALPLLPIYLLEGLVAGAAGNAVGLATDG